MKALVTGAGGQVGQALVRSAPAGVTALPLSRAELDITDASAATEAIRKHAPSVVINTAAYTAVDKAESEPDAARAANETGPANLADAATRAGVRVIQLSTDFVFDGAASVPYPPDHEPAPLSVYGATKLGGERAVLDRLGRRAVVLRTAWVYAASGRNFVLTMLKIMREKRSVRVVADQVGTPTSAESIARAVWAISAQPALSGVHHWTDAGVASWYDFAVAIAEEALLAGLLAAPVDVIPITTAEYPTPARRPRFSVLDTRATRDALGIRAPHWRASLRRVLAEVPRG
jgi:dTDP-4-dehydrorhamnose reductase